MAILTNITAEVGPKSEDGCDECSISDLEKKQGSHFLLSRVLPHIVWARSGDPTQAGNLAVVVRTGGTWRERESW